MNLLLLHTPPRLGNYIHIHLSHFGQDDGDTSIHGHPKSTQTIQKTYQQPFHVYETT
jgi:hypothetical protein